MSWIMHPWHVWPWIDCKRLLVGREAIIQKRTTVDTINNIYCKQRLLLRIFIETFLERRFNRIWIWTLTIAHECPFNCQLNFGINYLSLYFVRAVNYLHTVDILDEICYIYKVKCVISCAKSWHIFIIIIYKHSSYFYRYPTSIGFVGLKHTTCNII